MHNAIPLSLAALMARAPVLRTTSYAAAAAALFQNTLSQLDTIETTGMFLWRNS